MGNQNDTNEYGYNGYTTAQTVVGDQDLSGRHFFLTGCNTGIGLETARVLFRAGASITMACRNDQKMQKAKETIEKSSRNSKGTIQTLVLDLSSLQKVRESVANYRENFRLTNIDVLILNAGVMDVAKGLSEDGFEFHMAINHFGHSLLTFLLLPLMNDKEGNRIVFLSSKAHRFGRIYFDDMDFRKRDYSGFKAYGQSKLANIAFSKELDKRLKEKGKKIEVFSVHPGVIKTELGRDSFRVRLFYTFGSAFCKSIEQGAATTVFAALDRRLKGMGGTYFKDCGRGTVKAGSLNDQIMKRFFDITETRIKQKFPFDSEQQEEEQEEQEEEEGEEEEEEEIKQQGDEKEEEKKEEEISIDENPQEEEQEEQEEQEEKEQEEKEQEEKEEEEEEKEPVDEFEEEEPVDDFGGDDGLDDIHDEGMGRKKKEEESEEEEDDDDEEDDDMDDIVDEGATPKKKDEEDEDEDF